MQPSRPFRVVFVAGLLWASAAFGLPLLKTARVVHSLSTAEAARRYPVHLRAVRLTMIPILTSGTGHYLYAILAAVSLSLCRLGPYFPSRQVVCLTLQA